MSGGGNPNGPGSGKWSDIDQKWPMAPTQFTAAEVAKHNNKKDCWVIINKYIYDVTGKHRVSPISYQDEWLI
ncbi:hypothetical protein F4824DRAFT_434198 [Ustulina deusta]|nr:hypothetical protein F4824DRAFT_434198 [Ustulina deusta]